MFGIDNYAGFVVAILVFQAVPGPGTLVILNAAARGGVRGGLGAVAGTLCGDALFMLAAVAGLAAVMQAHPLAFGLLQGFGAVYLAWIGLNLLVARAGPGAAAPTVDPGPRGWFRRALLVCLTNPKAILFFVAFFPLFLRADASPATLAVMMAHVTGLSLLYELLLVAIGNWAARRLATVPAVGRIASRVAGATLVAFGLRLALADR